MAGLEIWPGFRPRTADVLELLEVAWPPEMWWCWLFGGGVRGGGGINVRSCLRGDHDSTFTRFSFRRRVNNGTDGIAKERQNSFVLTAGDNVAESIAAISKKQLRRMGLLSTSAQDPIEHRNLLCAHYLNKGPGLLRVLRALALHKQKASSGLTKPGDAFKKPLWDV